MTKINTLVSAVAASLVLSGSALAASLQPATGEAPFFDGPVAATSQVDRATVAAEAATHQPAAGEMSAQADVAPHTQVVSREQVRQTTAAVGNRLGEFPAAVGVDS